jgi:lysozyme
MKSKLEEMLIRQEGNRKFPYECTAGKLTIGVGRNLDDMGLTEDEVLYLLDNDIQRCDTELLHNFKWYAGLCRARQDALINLCFNIGITRLLTFTNSLAYMEAEDYEKAADEFLDSKWAEQVGNRAIEVTELIRKGHY